MTSAEIENTLSKSELSPNAERAQHERPGRFALLKRMLAMLLLVALFIAGIGFAKFLQIKKAIAMGKSFAPPPAAVSTLVVKPQTWQPVLNAVGSLKAVNGVVLSADLAGVVSEILFESGKAVKKGDLLVKLDTQQEQAQLHSAEAKLELARLDLERKRDLLTKRAISPSDLDAAESQFQQMKAAVEEARAVIARKQIVAPFDGILGIRMVNLGQYLNPGAPVVPLQSLDPIYVEFFLPQHELEKLSVGKKLRLKSSGGEEFDAEISALDSRVDEATRNILIQGTARNPRHQLRPGMFVNVEVLLPEENGVLAIPASSISYAPYGDSVFVVKNGKGADGQPAKIVEQRFVKIGPARGDQVSILSGIKAGDEVVTSGAFRLRAGAPVTINNSVQPDNNPNPQPADS